MTIRLTKILLFILMGSLPFGAIQAQKGKKKKPAPKTTAGARAPKKPTSKGKQTKPSTAKKGKTAAKPNPLPTPPSAPFVLPQTPRQGNGNSKRDETLSITSGGKDTATPAPIVLSDTATTPSEVIITSAFKPTLRNASKINFTAATPLVDTSKVVFNYNVPSQNLFFSYEPVVIKPLALAIDSSIVWDLNQYVKVGFGNYVSPYLEGGASFGNGTKSVMSVHGKYVGAKGGLPNQEYSKAGIDVQGVITTMSNQELGVKAYWDNHTTYRYGYEPDTQVFVKDSLRARYNSFGLVLGLQNKNPTSKGFYYHPMLHLNYFGNTANTKEWNALVKLPVSKAVSRLLAFDAGLNLDYTRYTNKVIPDTATVNNTVVSADLGVRFRTPNFKLYLGIQPGFDSKGFFVLPQIRAERSIPKTKLLVELGFVGTLQKNNYQYLAKFNPYITAPKEQFNTRTSELYFGLKGTITKHLVGNVRATYLSMIDAPLFINDLSSLNKSQNFLLKKSPSIQAFNLKAEANYMLQEKFSLLASLSYTSFTKVDVFEKAYGLLPLEVNGAMKWRMLPKLSLKSDVSFFGGSNFIDSKGENGTMSLATDVNVGVEYNVLKRLNVWADLNNLLNNQYQRWNQYRVLGIQLQAGVVYSFR